MIVTQTDDVIYWRRWTKRRRHAQSSGRRQQNPEYVGDSTMSRQSKQGTQLYPGKHTYPIPKEDSGKFSITIYTS